MPSWPACSPASLPSTDRRRRAQLCGIWECGPARQARSWRPGAALSPACRAAWKSTLSWPRAGSNRREPAADRPAHGAETRGRYLSAARACSDSVARIGSAASVQLEELDFAIVKIVARSHNLEPPLFQGLLQHGTGLAQVFHDAIHIGADRVVQQVARFAACLQNSGNDRLDHGANAARKRRV